MARMGLVLLLIAACGSGDEVESQLPGYIEACAAVEERDAGGDMPWTFERDGDRFIERADIDGDGELEQSMVWRFTEDERRLSLTIRHGDVESYTERREYEGGELARLEVDIDGSGPEPPRVTTSHYQNDRLVRRETDSDSDGQLDSIDTVIYDGDLAVQIDRDTDLDGSADETFHYMYEGQALIRWERRGFAGALFEIGSYTRDERGNVTEERVERPSLGPDQVIRSRWDESDRVLSRELVHLDNGEVEYRNARFYSYDCN